MSEGSSHTGRDVVTESVDMIETVIFCMTRLVSCAMSFGSNRTVSTGSHVVGFRLCRQFHVQQLIVSSVGCFCRSVSQRMDSFESGRRDRTGLVASFVVPVSKTVTNVTVYFGKSCNEFSTRGIGQWCLSFFFLVGNGWIVHLRVGS